jgi:hypothetical protein
MTFVAGVIGRLLSEQDVVHVAMHSVTPGAGHLAGIDRMRKRAMLIHACDLVTGGADIGLRRCLQDGITPCVTFVTAGARNFIDCMCRRMPPGAELFLVTGTAHSVLHRHRCV